MHRKSLVMSLAPALALLACSQSPPPNQFADGRHNGAVPALTVPPGGQSNGSSGNGLWGVEEAEDEASHRGIDFIAFNRTGQTIASLSIRPDEGPLAPGAPETPWSANVLTQRELPDGQRAAAHYEADIELCRWQVRATFADRRTRDYPAVNLCEAIRIDLR